jgi:hypothetical protein
MMPTGTPPPLFERPASFERLASLGDFKGDGL